MPTRTQSDAATTEHGRVPTAQEMDRLWEDLAGEEPSYEAVDVEWICEAIEFDAKRDAPGEARRRVVRALRGRGCGEHPTRDAALLVTELAANAVVHARSSFSVSVSLRHSTLRVDIADGKPLAADLSAQEWLPRRGHGLGLIDAICVRWGADLTADGKIVWGELRFGGEGEAGTRDDPA